MKKIFALVLSLLLGLFCCSCSLLNKPSDPNDPGGNNGNKGFTIAIIDNNRERGIMDKILAGFKAAHPEVTEPISYVSYSGDYTQKIQNQASAGVLPDIFLTIDTLVGHFAKNNISLNLNDYLTEQQDLLDDIYSSILQLGMVDGELHMVAREYARMCVYYNKTLLKGNPEPQNGWTWAQFKALAEKLVVKNDSGTIVVNGVDGRLNWPPPVLSYIYGFGGRLMNEDGTAGGINAGTADAFDQIKSLVASGAMTNSFAPTGTSFSSGTVAMYIGGRADMTSFSNQLGAGNWDVAAFPDMPTPAIGSGTSGYSISAKSRYKDIAVKLLLYMLSEEGQNVFGETGNNVPVRISMADKGAWRAYNPDINNDAFVYHPEYDVPPVNALVAQSEKTSKVIDVLNESLSDYLTKSIGREKMIADLNRAINNALA